MDNPGDILISVEERHAWNMLAGNKSVELRRRQLNISTGTRVWVYSKLPRGQIQAVAIVDEVIADTPKDIWNRYGLRSAISKSEFDAYFAGTETGYAIVFQEVRPLAPILNLSSIRDNFSNFQPPQFFKRLTNGSPELTFFQTALATK
ncbi:MAG: transcriptional regulator [Rhodospirillales bacterium]|jgi:predicted transcriptional regulator|nr:transcriptional regulator [Rhodospirillales bacterium]